MYTAATIKTELIDLIGWRQNPDSAGTQLTGLTTSSSGLWFNDVHPLLTFDNLEAIAPQFSGFTASDLTDWLQEKTESGIIGAVEDWIRAKFEVRTAKNLLESKRLFDNAPSLTVKDTNDGKLAGLEIVPARTRGTQTVIERIGLQFDTAQDIVIRLYRAGTAAHIQTVTVTYATAGDLQWETVNWTLDGHGAYWIAYEQANLSGQSYNTILDYSNVTDQLNTRVRRSQYYLAYPVGRYALVTPFENPGAFGAFDASDNSYTVGSNYGLNLELHVQCDYTDFIVRHSDILKGLIQKRVAMDLLREIAYNANTRVNRHESNASINQVLYEIDGDSQGRPGGLRHTYEMELKATTMDQDKIDPVCLPCKRRSVRYKAI